MRISVPLAPVVGMLSVERFGIENRQDYTATETGCQTGQTRMEYYALGENPVTERSYIGFEVGFAGEA